MPRHHESRQLPYTARQMYDLVADVQHYPEFLPWNSAARINSRVPVMGGAPGDEVIEADLVISFKVFRERFGSRVTLLPGPGLIHTQYLDGPFKRLKSTWAFAERPATADMPISCQVTFDVDFEFRNAILATVIGLVFNEAMARVVRAFESRAKAVYGTAYKG